ncbi:MAG: hypothetical protein NTW25_12480, partial [Candidatus Kapabacteria bacterium]|nr:hypothetical protein [Candidatus Kapabacteria bacterium]
MQRNKFDFKKFITPFDFIIVAVIIVGLAIAVFFTQEIAVQLIGVAITVLAVVFLIINISQRMSEIVDTRYKPANPPPNFTITVKQDGKAKRQVIEDFDSTYGEVESNRGFKNKSNPQVFDISSAEEGFRVVSVSSEKNTSDESSSKRDFVKSEPRKIDNKEDSIADFSKKHKEVVPEENSNNIEEVNELDSKQNELKVLRFDDLEDEIETLEEAKSEIPVIADNEIVIENDNVINEIVIENVNVINEVVNEEIEQKQSQPESLDDALDEFITFSNEINSANENWVDLEEYHSDSLEIYEEPVSLELSTEFVQEQLEHVEIMENDIQTDMLDIEVKQIAVFDEEMTPPEVQISAEISKGYTEKFIDYPLSALMEEVPNLSDEPRKEFDYMISRV